MKVWIRVSAIAAISAIGLVLVSTAVARAKPTSREFDRVQAAGRAALFALGLVDIRGCDRTNLRCIDTATAREMKAFARAATVEGGVARRLSNGKCKSTMLVRARGYARHAANVQKARRAWHARDYQAAARFYYARTLNQRAESLVLRYCW